MALSLKSLLFVSLFIAAMTAPIAEAQLGLVSGLLGLIRIQGTVFCTPNGNMDANGTATPVFPNALVQLQCGAGNVVSSATTNGLAVNTPLSNCNSKLPAVVFAVHRKHSSRPSQRHKHHSCWIPIHGLMTASSLSCNSIIEGEHNGGIQGTRNHFTEKSRQHGSKVGLDDSMVETRDMLTRLVCLESAFS
ncbi:hypothetical protein JRO89_XS03G0170800 [Xanthoceras sorbifolium]|uniref:Phylloplanin-like n=1 Tax=Xanthoceras sorbifolium TaxID=99658 RepID=A0ABQ8IA86_9ROSI|nr:hypothetical protein JRO89_XS03G0170800 [Xanthoceras sorbifolium]